MTLAARDYSDPGTRFLIVNADDFGQSEGINAGVLRAHDEGIVTSASLMVHGAAAAPAAMAALTRPRMSIGLHLDFGEWEYDGSEWQARYTVGESEDEGSIRDVVEEQLQTFRELIGAEPTHIDSHQHVHMRAPFGHPIRQIAGQLGIPLRRRKGPIVYSGAFYGQSGRGDSFPEGITLEALLATLRDLPAGMTELGCHPAAFVDVDGVYVHERLVELAVLCDQRVRDALSTNRIQLSSFRDAAANVKLASSVMAAG